MSKMTTRTRRAGGAKRAAALDAAIEVVAARGFERTRFTDVAAASGVAVGTLQNYFGSREDMLVEALSRIGELEAEAQESAIAVHEDPWDQLVALVDRNLGTTEQNDRMLVELWYAAIRDEEIREYSEVLWRRYRDVYFRVVGNGCNQGVFEPNDDPESVVEVLLVTLVGGILSRSLRHPETTGPSFRELVLTQLSACLGVASPRGSKSDQGK